MALKQSIEEGQGRASILNSSGITNTDLETWTMEHFIDNIGYGFLFCQSN